MAYFLDFDERALKEWRKLGSTVREQLKKKLVEVLESPRIEANKLRGMPDCYKIKLRSSGYRLVYQVIDEKVVVFVISVGKRERSEVYSEAVKRTLYTILCKCLFSEVTVQAVTELDNKAAHCHTPVPQRHRPFL